MKPDPTAQIEEYHAALSDLRVEDDDHGDPVLAQLNASFAGGLLFGAGFPGASATVTFLFRKAYPGARFHTLFDREEH
jgi:hypothetical protein